MSITYADSGVNIEAGDAASKAAYHNAKTTFTSRKGLIGEPFALEGGFSGALDMGDYLLIQNDDGTGSKSEIAELIGKYDTIGTDLCGTVVDDAICVGAEVLSLTNTFDVPNVNPKVLEQMIASLASACVQQKVVIPGGEIAEVPGATKKIVWNATGVGVVKKDKFISGQNIKPGQAIVGLHDPMLRSNGFSLARKVLENEFGADWHSQPFVPEPSTIDHSPSTNLTWAETLLTPSKIFHRLLLDTVLGDFEAERPFTVHGLAHITGGGVPGNLPRILPVGLGAELPNLHAPHDAVKQLQQLGDLDEAECYRTWHCGTAMLLVCEATDADVICQALNQADEEVQAQIVGTITDQPTLSLTSQFSGKNLEFSVE